MRVLGRFGATGWPRSDVGMAEVPPLAVPPATGGGGSCAGLRSGAMSGVSAGPPPGAPAAGHPLPSAWSWRPGRWRSPPSPCPPRSGPSPTSRSQRVVGRGAARLGRRCAGRPPAWSCCPSYPSSSAAPPTSTGSSPWAVLGPGRAEQLDERVAELTESRSAGGRRRRGRAPPHRARPARRRPAAPGRAGHGPRPGPGRSSTPIPTRPGRSSTTPTSEAKQALAELRDLARGIHPAVLTDRGLDAALSPVAARSPVPVKLAVDVARPARRRRSRASPTSSSPRRSPTWPSTPGATRAVGHRRPAGRPAGASRSPTTASAAPTPAGGTGPGRPARPGRGRRRLAARAQPGRRADHRPRGAPVRIVIAEDSVLLRAGLTRLLDDAGEEVVAAVGDADGAARRGRPPAARPRHRRRAHAADASPTRASGPRCGSAPQCPRSACSCCRQYVEERVRHRAARRRHRPASATC